MVEALRHHYQVLPEERWSRLFSHVLSELYSIPLYGGRTSHTHRLVLAHAHNPRIVSAYPTPIECFRHVTFL